MHFIEWKILNFDSYFTEVSSQGSNWQLVSFVSGNGLAPNRRQAITWTKAYLHISNSHHIGRPLRTVGQQKKVTEVTFFCCRTVRRGRFVSLCCIFCLCSRCVVWNIVYNWLCIIDFNRTWQWLLQALTLSFCVFNLKTSTRQKMGEWVSD